MEMQEWPEGLTDLVDAKRVSIGVARVLMRIPDDTTLKYLANQAAENGATVAQAVAWYHSYISKPWKLPTPEEIAEAKKRLEPPPRPYGSVWRVRVTNANHQPGNVAALPNVPATTTPIKAR